MEERLREREKPQKLRVVFPDGETLCYTSSKETFVQTLRRIGIDRLSTVDIMADGAPMITKTIIPKHQRHMESLGDGWYVNIGGSTHTKYMRLKSISEKLNLGLIIDKSDDFKGEKVSRGSKGVSFLQVSFPDGTVIGESNTTETFFETVIKIGIERVEKLNLTYNQKNFITSSQQYNSQVQIAKDKWLVIPASTKDKVKMLNVMNVVLHLGIKIEYI
mgnify:FL=1